ncbi:hypothetical protein M9H77_16185 [Catharanthus roseus]|uniref:Uncharacterized protein n=1 Tax=Catharanthus roseus TaxID=4058 RepID=A0ACC0B131_CATRO|nr:hypothetical protein M9H77_16185 [Catharanthus roseus]
MMLKKWHALNSIPAFTFLYSSSAVNVLEKGCILRLARTFLESDVVDYSKLTLDTNPLHFDPKCAKDAGFTDRLVPGMLVASVFPRVIASYFPGAVYVSQNLHFKIPVYIKEEINAEIQAIVIREMKNKYIAKFTTKCFKGGDNLVIDGEATAILPSLTMEPV